MSKKEMFQLIQPCKNRGLSYEQKDQSMIINRIEFDVEWKASEYLASIPRIDI